MSKDTLRTLLYNVCSKISLKNWKRKDLKGKSAFLKEATPITGGEMKRPLFNFFFFLLGAGCCGYILAFLFLMLKGTV